MEGFRSCIVDCQLIEVPLVGFGFTWEWGRDSDSLVLERLDRAFVAADWLNSFPCHKLFNLVSSYSDHSSIKLFVSAVFLVKRAHRFKFENTWLLNNDFLEVVSCAWSQDRNVGVLAKICACSATLTDWQNSQDHNFTYQIAILKKRIDVAHQAKVDDVLIVRLKSELSALLAQEVI
ncbi:hypothetical protein K2173_005027 [Erythroxylum novogranatense]|uniref:Uncharacterized protein n=1 Tax=Erythroxylum novogranatense TaxID=1862640 RepID=A0AAV8TBC3_9ROSI|nr:hypothetical protein K2173_005027 [Erythroxylum novogranatense]